MNRTKETDHIKYWGFSEQDFKGEPFESSSRYNLAKHQYDDIWDSDIYDLTTWGKGYCHTYNPPDEQNVGFDFRI